MTTTSEGNTTSISAVGLDVAKKLLHEVVIKAVIEKIITAIPFFGLPIINPIFVFIVTQIAEKLYDQIVLVGGNIIIDLREDAKQREYEEATNILRFKLKENQDAEAIEKAKAEYKKKLGDLIRMDRPAAA